MVLYFPVSALVTLFGNILQNPLDPRAKSDARLMNLVVTFLSMLGSEAESGGVHRMLSVCAEFERIGKKVIERAEKEQSSRRKRKSHEPPGRSSVASPPPTSHSTPKLANASTPTPQPISIKNEMPHARSGTPNGGQLSPPPHQIERPHSARSFSPMAAGMAAEPSPGMPSAGWPGQHPDYPQQEPNELGSFSDLTGFGPNGGIRSPHMGMGMAAPFQQPLLPHDLYALPMTLDWDWAEMSGGAYPSVENGNFGEQGRPR